MPKIQELISLGANSLGELKRDGKAIKNTLKHCLVEARCNKVPFRH